MLTSVSRYAISFALAIIVTLGLLWSMQKLITGGKEVLSEAPRGNVLDFIRLKKEESVVKKERKPQKPQKPKQPPPQMQQPQMQQANPNVNAVASNFSTEVQVDSGLSGGLSLGSSDGDYLPIVKVAPIYPRRAQSRDGRRLRNRQTPSAVSFRNARLPYLRVSQTMGKGRYT